MCGVASYLVFKTFKQLGYKPTFCMNDEHCFLLVNDYYIDLTLKQFGYRYPHVSIRRNPVKFQKIQDTAKTEKKIRKLFYGWVEYQNPFRQELPKIVIDY
jgi:hypothetical protein